MFCGRRGKIIYYVSEIQINVDLFDNKRETINPVTQEEKQHPLYEPGSSHLARRTFIGNVYKFVKDPNIIGSMSGHVEGSKAFARYREIDDEIKRDALKGIE